MGSWTVELSLISFHLLLFTLFTCSPTAFSSSNSTIAPLDGINESPFCALIDCGHGKCVSTGALLGMECECDAGWKKMQIGLATIPSCIVPNCTINFDCGSGAPSAASPPPAFSFPSPLEACNGVWCGEGTCISNGNEHTCQCNEGSVNLFNKTDLACFKPCSLGPDCSKLGLGPQPPAPALPPLSSTLSAPGPTGNGSSTSPAPALAAKDTTGAPNSSGKLRALTMTLLAAPLLSWL